MEKTTDETMLMFGQSGEQWYGGKDDGCVQSKDQ
jgi:hypothetical protein